MHEANVGCVMQICQVKCSLAGIYCNSASLAVAELQVLQLPLSAVCSCVSSLHQQGAGLVLCMLGVAKGCKTLLHAE